MLIAAGVSLMIGVIWQMPRLAGFLMILVGFLLMLCVVVLKFGLVQIEELWLGVVKSHSQQEIVRFLPSGWHLVTPLFEEVTFYLSLLPQVKRIKFKTVSNEGLAVTIGYAVRFSIDPRLAPPNERGQVALLLRDRLDDTLNFTINRELRTMSLHSPLATWWQPSGYQQVAFRLFPSIEHALAAEGIKLLEFSIEDIKIPAEIATILSNAHERGVMLGWEIESLEAFKKVVAALPETDLKYLADLWRSLMLGKNGFMYPLISGNPENNLPGSGRPNQPARQNKVAQLVDQ